MLSSKTAIFSLTGQGANLANRILIKLPDAEHLHRPKNLIATAQQTFTEGANCVFICSTGIVVRALAPVLRDKFQDPAVLVLDEHGEFVIPLLSGHEGGASALGAIIAEGLGAKLVQTSATDYSRPVYCIGLGSDKGCPAQMLRSLYDKAILALPAASQAELIASIDLKQNEPAILALAKELGQPFRCFDAATLRQVESQLSQKSEIVFREVGCYGVAEAAALIGASNITGNPAELVLTKQKNTRSTISVARSYR